MKTSLTVSRAIEYRRTWMGVAMIWTVLFHAAFELPFTGTLFRLGYGGSDIFMFASGVGCWYSLKKDPDPLSFYKRRAIRLLPAFFIFLPVWSVFKYFSAGLTLKQFLGNLLFFGYFFKLDNQFNWFLSGIVAFYILSPFLFVFIKRYKAKPAVLCFAGMISAALSCLFFDNYNFIIVAARLPVFYMGMLLGMTGTESGFVLSRKTAAGMGAFALAGAVALWFSFHSFSSGFAWNYGLYWYPFILITPGLCAGISFVFDRFSENRALCFIKKIIDFAGARSLEIYLVHVLLFDMVKYFGLAERFGRFVAYCSAIAVTVAAAALLSAIVKIPAAVKKRKGESKA